MIRIVTVIVLLVAKVFIPGIVVIGIPLVIILVIVIPLGVVLVRVIGFIPVVGWWWWWWLWWWRVMVTKVCLPLMPITTGHIAYTDMLVFNWCGMM